MASLLFFLPSGTRDSRQHRLPRTDWNILRRLPWDMILLFGGGFALASGFKATALDKWLAMLEGTVERNTGLAGHRDLCLTLTMLTELTSNVATVNAIIPTVLALAAPLDIDPRMLFVPADARLQL